MKRAAFLSLFAFLLGCATTEQVNSLDDRISFLQDYILKLEARIDELSYAIDKQPTIIPQINNVADTLSKNPGQCKAITKAGAQCKRTAKEGSDYCWQHQGYSKTTAKEKSSGYSGDKTILTGPRGGQYYINSKGNKTYIKKKK